MAGWKPAIFANNNLNTAGERIWVAQFKKSQILKTYVWGRNWCSAVHSTSTVFVINCIVFRQITFFFVST